MKKLLALLMLVLPVMGMENDVEEYSDKTMKNNVFSPIKYSNVSPNLKIIYENTCPKNFCVNGFQNMSLTYKEIVKKMNKIGFVQVGLQEYYFKENMNTTNAMFFFNKETSDFIFVILKKMSIFKLESFTGRVHELVNDPCKWIFPRNTNSWNGKIDNFNELSWHHIDCLLNYSISSFNNDWNKALCEKVTKNTLEKSITRLVFYFDYNKMWKIFTPTDDSNSTSLFLSVLVEE
jgi:hypothetical protein